MSQTSLISAIQYQITVCSKYNYNETAHKALWTTLFEIDVGRQNTLI